MKQRYDKTMIEQAEQNIVYCLENRIQIVYQKYTQNNRT